MTRSRLLCWTVLPACLLGFGLMAGYAAKAALKPAVIAFVDLEKVFNNLESRKASETERRAQLATMQERGERMHEELELLEAELESLEPGSDAMAELTSRSIEVSGRVRAYQKYMQLITERESAGELRDTYDLIRETAGLIAAERGIDMVLLNDSIPEIDLSSAQRTLQQISARRILWGNSQLDITDDLLKRMNDMHGAAGG